MEEEEEEMLNKQKGNILYWKEGKTLQEIADLFNLSYSKVWRFFKRENILRRVTGSPREANHLLIDNNLYELIEGLLLGDGTLSTQRNNISAYFENGDKRLSYLKWLSSKLNKKGLKQSGNIYPMKHVKNGAFKYKTLTYFELGKIRERWHPNNIKQIPDNFKITPTKLKLWYIGDGNYSIVPLIDSSNFSFKSLIKISLELKNIGINNTLNEFKDRKRIRISRKSEDKFFEYILSKDKEIPTGYEYKFPEVLQIGS